MQFKKVGLEKVQDEKLKWNLLGEEHRACVSAGQNLLSALG